MEDKIYLIKFSLISFLFSIVVLIMYLFPDVDLLFIKKAHEPGLDSSLDPS